MARPRSLSREDENLLILRVKTSRELTIDQICAEFGVTRRTYNNILARRELESKSSGPDQVAS